MILIHYKSPIEINKKSNFLINISQNLHKNNYKIKINKKNSNNI